MINPYQVLGAYVSMDDADIKTLYKQAAQRAHPDKGGSVEAFNEVREAYSRIATPAKRKETNAFYLLSKDHSPCDECYQKGFVKAPLKSFRKTSVQSPILCPKCNGCAWFKKR